MKLVKKDILVKSLYSVLINIFLLTAAVFVGTEIILGFSTLSKYLQATYLCIIIVSGLLIRISLNHKKYYEWETKRMTLLSLISMLSFFWMGVFAPHHHFSILSWFGVWTLFLFLSCLILNTKIVLADNFDYVRKKRQEKLSALVENIKKLNF